MHDNEGTKESGSSEKKNWFERQADTIKRLGEIQRRFAHPDGTPTETLLAQLNAEVDAAQKPTLPTPDEVAYLRKSRQQAGSGSDGVAGLLATMASTFETMNQPSPLDLNGAICDGDLNEVRRLLDAGVNPNALTSTDDTMLKLAGIMGHANIAALLRERGAAYGMMEAALAGDAHEIARLLDAAGHDVNKPDRTGDTALKLAVYKGRTDVVRLLLSRGADPNRVDKQGHSPLASACVEGFPEIARLLVEAGGRVGIVEAAYLGDIALVSRLLQSGADRETVNAAHASPLLAASDCGHVEVARFLLQHGANPSKESQTGRMALAGAVARERVPVIHLLIDYGADPNAVSKRFGSSPLASAVTFGKLRSMEALLARGANPNLASRGGKTPLHECAFHFAPSLRKPQGVMVRIAAVLLDAGANIEARDEGSFTPLMRAAQSGDADMVRLLLARGADVLASVPNGHFTPLSCVRGGGLKDKRDKTEARTLIMQALGQEYAVYDAAQRGDAPHLAALLDAGAPADQGIVFDKRMQDCGLIKAEDKGNTPLSAAAENGHIAVVKWLLTRGDVSTHSKNLALFAAEYKHHEEVAHLLREAGAINTVGIRRNG